jgi:hypothetical protein
MAQRIPAGVVYSSSPVFLRANGLTVALSALFVLAITAMGVTGWKAHDDDLAEHGAAAPGQLSYLGSGDSASAVFETWKNEFLQMAAYVGLTAHLFQRTSVEARDPDSEPSPDSPPPSGIAAFLRTYSLGPALAGLIVAVFALHLWGSDRAAAAEAALHENATHSPLPHLGDVKFWCESFQNCQFEFLATAALVVLSLVLRFRGAPESKHVYAGNAETGR